jgi:dolichol-phosphate mannosyltransferase
MSPDLSVVIPFHNEAENVSPLIAELYAALAGHGRFEVICVDDGSTDATFAELQACQREHPGLRLAQHRERYGQSAAVRTGVKRARAPWIATLDGDGQSDPADIPKLLAAARDPGTPETLGLVIGLRRPRLDPWIKRVSSRIANGLRAWVLADGTPDSGCGLKLMRREVFLDLPFFDHMHRFMPALVVHNGGAVVSVRVSHRPRRRGRSHYGVLDRASAGVVDLLGVLWLRARARRVVAEDWDARD